MQYDNPFLENFGKNIQREIEKKGWTRYRLQKESGVDKQSLGKIVRGNMAPNIERAHKIAVALGVTLDYLCAIHND